MLAASHPCLPTAWAAREALREKGQFWTPDWLARAMAAWVVQETPPVLFDPAVGPGTFFAAARAVGFAGACAGFELHPQPLVPGALARSGAPPEVTPGDFLGARLTQKYPAIISNPPYIRHHRLAPRTKAALQRLAARALGFSPDGRAGIHLYFLVKCLDLLSPGGRLAFLLPADVCEGVSAGRLWARLCQQFRIEAVLTFSAEATPFPRVDTNALVFLLSNRPPVDSFLWVRVRERAPEGILRALQGGADGGPAAEVQRRSLAEALGTGLSRPPRPETDGVPLSSLARIVRGIATGANDFFFLTRQQMAGFGLEREAFVRAVGRTRDCPEDVLTEERLAALDAANRPTWLLKLGGTPEEVLPVAVRRYLERGEQLGLPGQPLLRTRHPWYRMEHRAPPPLLFGYLGRRECRFIWNRAGVVPLTGFLCVYPLDEAPAAVEKLWRALNHLATAAQLTFVAKSYGSGALKAEPRQLDRLLIPRRVLRETGVLPG